MPRKKKSNIKARGGRWGPGKVHYAHGNPTTGETCCGRYVYGEPTDEDATCRDCIKVSMGERKH